MAENTTVVLDGNCGLWVLFLVELFHPGPGAHFVSRPTERLSEVMGFPVDG